jgi:hypothetical protein
MRVPLALEERMLAPVSRLVPAVRRADWVREWQAEFWQLRHAAERDPGRSRKGAGRNGLCEALSLSYGLIADAVWLRMDWLQLSARGSAAGCLVVLAAYCLLCAGVELVVAGSWRAFERVIWGHLSGGFVFVAVPGLIAALATYPLRPLRCDERDAKLFSARVRWNLFLAVKMALTLALGFLFPMVACLPLRAAIGARADWVELLLWLGMVSLGLRWALLNQEQRCQRCLRMMKQPTRLGLASRNFLEWSGTELACADGHGLLQVAEMTGSWCWYDLWVKLDGSYREIFTA